MCKEIFKNWWEDTKIIIKDKQKSIPAEKQIFLSRLYWSESTWNRCMNGDRQMTEAEKRMINIISKERDYNICFDEYTNS